MRHGCLCYSGGQWDVRAAKKLPASRWPVGSFGWESLCVNFTKTSPISRREKLWSYSLAAESASPSGKMILLTMKNTTMDTPPLRTVVPMLYSHGATH